MVYCFLKRETTSSLFVRGHSFPPEGSGDYDPNGKNISEEILALMKKYGSNDNSSAPSRKLHIY